MRSAPTLRSGTLRRARGLIILLRERLELHLRGRRARRAERSERLCRSAHDLRERGIIERCDQLGLHVQDDDPQQDFRVASFITTLVMNYLFTGKFKRTK